MSHNIDFASIIPKFDSILSRAAGYAEAIDKYLLISASLALEVLRELSSPGCEYL